MTTDPDLETQTKECLLRKISCGVQKLIHQAAFILSSLIIKLHRKTGREIKAQQREMT